MSKIRLPYFLLIAILLPSITFLVIQFARGYSLNLSKKKFEPRGILVANSVPNGAQVFINGEFKTATDNTLSLPPGEYLVEIKKDGYFSWTKKLKIEKELVVKTEAFLFPKAPYLKPITLAGAQNPLISPDGTKIVYSSLGPTFSAGFWVLDLLELPFGLGYKQKQILKSTLDKNYTKAQISWSFDSRQILLSLENKNFLLDPDQSASNQNLIDITWDLKSIKTSWEQDEKKLTENKLKRLPSSLREILKNSASNLIFSPDGKKVAYLATSSATIPPDLIPPLPACSTQKEEREIKVKNWYVYDLKEDKNFVITNHQSLIANPSWFFTSRHLVLIEPEKISLIEYDGKNKTVVFTGPFENSYVFPAPNSPRIIILTKFGQQQTQPPNLYEINLM